MQRERVVPFLLAVFCLCGLLAAHRAFAGMDDMHMHDMRGMNHQMSHDEGEVVAKLTTEPEKVATGVPVTLHFALTDRQGNPVQGLTQMHERYLHVVIASQDFSVFGHIHPREFETLTPEVLKGGQFFVRFTFPKAGRYVVGIDFAVKGRHIGRHFIVAVAGKPEMMEPEKDFSRQRRVEGLDVAFATMPAQIKAGEKAVLTYDFQKDGKPVTDLEPWLGAPMHLAIVSSDLQSFLHEHGQLPGMPTHDHHEDHMSMMAVPPHFGPKIEVPLVFPAKGLYTVFGQVQHDGKVMLTKFMVEVQ